jgi:VWFA-related protein
MRRAHLVATVVMLIASSAAAAAQTSPPAASPSPVFTAHSDLVVLHVSVIERKSGFVAGLPKEAFAVYDDGNPQTIAFFRNEDTPVSVGLVIDNSGSMQPKREAVIAAGLAFAESSNPRDEMFTVNFNERVWTGLPPGQFTSDRGALRQALLRTTTRGQTALFDAMQLALGQLARGREQKKVLIVISDGGDNASRTARFADVHDTALRASVVIYAIGLFDSDDRDAKPKLLRELARATGGEAFFPKHVKEVTPILERIASEIRSGYTIGYAPSAGTLKPGYHAIAVQVRAPDRRKLTVRARAGYMAGAASETHDR